jgi:hypothetical protein
MKASQHLGMACLWGHGCSEGAREKEINGCLYKFTVSLAMHMLHAKEETPTCQVNAKAVGSLHSLQTLYRTLPLKICKMIYFH